MSRTIRFPLPSAVPSVGSAETSLVIELLSGATSLLKGGGSAGGIYTSIEPWKTLLRETESPYACVVIEFTATAEMIIGDGTFAQQIGLFGGIATAVGFDRFLIGVLGMNHGNATLQIPITANNAGANLVGYAQKVSDVACYDTLSVGGVFNDIAVTGEGDTFTVTARPIRSRDYMG